MHTTISRFGVMTTACLVLAAGCRDDPPPPTVTAQQDTAASSTASQRKRPDARLRDTRGPRVSPEAMKRYRVETCYFGTLGLRYAKDAYLASLGGAEPGPGKIPSFGEYPEMQPQRPHPQRPDQPHIVPPENRLPFIRHVRSCSIAKGLKEPAEPELDAALTEYERYVVGLNRNLMEANRYYQRKQQEKDEFKRGQALHKRLIECEEPADKPAPDKPAPDKPAPKPPVPTATATATATASATATATGAPTPAPPKMPCVAFSEMDASFAAFAQAVDKWYQGLQPLKDELDEGGKAADEAIKQARKVVVLLLAAEIDTAAVDTELGKLEEQLKKLDEAGEKDKRSPFPRMVGPELKKLAEAIKKAKEEQQGKALTSKQIHIIGTGMADLIETQHRALARLLRTKEGPGPARDLRLQRPRLRVPSAHPQPRPVAPREEP